MESNIQDKTIWNKDLLNPKRMNIPPVEFKALQELIKLQKEKVIIIKPADKGAGILVIDYTDYIVRYGPKDAAQFENWKELAKGTTDWKGTNFKTFLVCQKHFSAGQFERNYVNELLGLEKEKKLLTGAFPDKIQEGNLSIKVILAVVTRPNILN